MYSVHIITMPHVLKLASIILIGLIIRVCGDGGELKAYLMIEKRLTPYHHFFNERKITPVALSCNHGDDDIVSTCTNRGRPTTPGDILVVFYDLWRWIMGDHRNTH